MWAGAASPKRFRIGINLGDIILQDEDIYGDGVNVAARLEGLAEPGGICLARAARDQVRDKLDLRLADLGEVEVKNISRPVRAFQIILDDKATALQDPRIATTPPPRSTSRSSLPDGVPHEAAVADNVGG